MARARLHPEILAAPMMRSLVERHGVALAKYVVIGGLSALAEWSVFWLLLKAASLHYIAAAIVAFVVATFVNYLLCVRTIFASKTKSLWKDAAMVYQAVEEVTKGWL